jgi:NH3-dependent NAD+ synthetase
MRDLTPQSHARRSLLLLVPATILSAQQKPSPGSEPETDTPPTEIRLPNGKKQMDEILKNDYEKNLQDARDLTSLARSLEQDLEKSEAFVFSLTSLKKLDDMEKLTRRIRARMKRL